TLVHPAAKVSPPGSIGPVLSAAALLHDAPAAAADHLPGQRMNHPIGTAPGAVFQRLLDSLKGFQVDDGLMGIRHYNPFRFGQPDRLFGLIADLFVPSLNQIPCIGLVVEHLINGGTTPKGSIGIL